VQKIPIDPKTQVIELNVKTLFGFGKEKIDGKNCTSDFRRRGNVSGDNPRVLRNASKTRFTEQNGKASLSKLTCIWTMPKPRDLSIANGLLLP
jgi:hypothetical protein